MRFWKYLKLGFDRSFSVARLRQLLWLVGILLLSVTGFCGINRLLGDKGIEQARIVELMLDPGAFVYQSTYKPIPSANEELAPGDSLSPQEQIAEAVSLRHRVFHLIIALFGAVVFTGMLISVISNMLEGRIAAFRKGFIRYPFSGHILILGANEMLVNMLKAFARNDKTRHRDIVVLSTSDIEELRIRLFAELDKKERRHVTLLFGRRDSAEELSRVRVQRAYRVYILGECNEEEHDPVSISSLEEVQRLCEEREKILKCYLVINNLSSFHVFQYQAPHGHTPNIELNIVNSLENWAQRVLVSGCHEKIEYPAIDRGGIGPESEKSVHFVVVGMTQMAIAMATTAAHTAHYPNFATKGRRTRITFISADIEREMNFFKGHYGHLFELSHCSLLRWDSEGRPLRTAEEPNPQYGDFLDIEWEFIDAGIETPQVRELLKAWCTEAQYADELLTIAVCDESPMINAASALYLPDAVFTAGVPVFVYQPAASKVIEIAGHADRYRRLYPFGMKKDCYDSQLHRRMLNARRIHFLYDKCEQYVMMPANDAELDAMWYGLSFAKQLSNIYAANSIPAKMRSLHIDAKNPRPLTSVEVELIAEVEHNRWNVEKLLVGFRAMTAEQRAKITAEEAKRLKEKEFIHKDIAPYSEIPDDSRRYDRFIVRNMGEVIK